MRDVVVSVDIRRPPEVVRAALARTRAPAGCDATWTVAPLGDGHSRVTQVLRCPSSGWARLADPGRHWLLQRRLVRDQARLKARLEAT